MLHIFLFCFLCFISSGMNRMPSEMGVGNVNKYYQICTMVALGIFQHSCCCFRLLKFVVDAITGNMQRLC